MECLICSAEANGIHYKISACRACAAFFRRTVHMKIRYRCKLQRECRVYHAEPICRHCRMKKCLVLGMYTDGSDLLLDYYVYGSYSETDFNPDEREVFSPAACLDNHEEFDWNLKVKIAKILKKEYRSPNVPYKLSLCQQSAQACENIEGKYAQVLPKKERDQPLTSEHVDKFICELFIVLINVAEYFMEIEPFALLPYRDKVAIYKIKEQTFCDLAFSVRSMKQLGTDVNCTKMVMFDGHVADFQDFKNSVFSEKVSNIKSENMLELMAETHNHMDNLLFKPLKRMNPDDFEVQYLLQKSIWNMEDINGVSKETIQLADKIQVQLDEELAHYYNYTLKLENVAKRVYKVHNLLTGIEKIQKVRERERRLCETFDVFKFNLWIDDLP